MKKAQYIARLLILLCTLMWMAPVLPHHHHTDGQICMKDDMHNECHQQHNAHQEADHNHGCSDKGCITTHFFQQIPANTQREEASVQMPHTPLVEPILYTHLQLPKSCHQCTHCGYIEWLHSTCIQRAIGLRAPPCA